MTEHFTREEAETWEALQIADKGRKPVAVYMQAEIDALRATTAKLKEWEAQGDKAYKRGFSDGMKEAPTGESWIRAIDEAMVGAHIGVAEMADDYGTAKKKLNALICWSVQVDRDLSHALPAQPAEPAKDVGVLVEALERKLPGGKQTDDFESSRIGDYNQGWNDYRKAVKKMFKNINMNNSENSNPDAYLYSLEYGEKVVDTKVSIHQLNYPFGVAGADYLVRNDDGVSYVRQTKLYAALSRAQAAPAVGVPDACVWTPDTDYETDVHYSACGEAWSFIEGGPKENKVRFCQGCGKPVKLTYQPKIGGV